MGSALFYFLTDMFVDRVKIHVQAGDGGDGCASFRHERRVPHGGPDGGDGGDGGSVIMVAREGVDSLDFLAHKKHWKAESGDRGRGAGCHGRGAKDLVLEVPPGTIIVEAEAGHVLKDLTIPGEQVTVARGGRGGKGNLRFKSSTNRTPRQFTPGEKGEAHHLLLELKVIADVGLIGKPNAGKSTLLSRVSRARPEIAAYPFTTKHPNLGRVQIDMDRSFVMADIPGLIEGAHSGAGLGHEFLRHIERSGVLVHLVEPQPLDGSDPVANYHAIHRELEQYDVKLGQRPEIVVVTKCELPGSDEVQWALSASLGRETLAISAVTGEGMDRLLATIVQTIDAQRHAAQSSEAPVTKIG